MRVGNGLDKHRRSQPAKRSYYHMNKHVNNHTLFQSRSPFKSEDLGRYPCVYSYKFKGYQAHNVREMVSGIELEGEFLKTAANLSTQLEDQVLNSAIRIGG